jgi:hypothetical protein
MHDYPEVVAKIANDYLERVKLQLRLVPVREQDEFLREIQSHLYEAYQQTPGDDDVARVLAVLRNLGEPADLVSDGLPGRMMRSGAKWNLPLYVIGGILIAFFGIPLGFGGVAVLAGILLTLVGIVATYYATVGVVFLTGALFMLLGLTRMYAPGFWDRLVAIGIIQIDGQLAEFLNVMSPSGQGLLMLAFAGAFIGAGLGMLFLGRYLVRGLRFLFSLVSDWLPRFARSVRGKLRQTANVVGRTLKTSEHAI